MSIFWHGIDDIAVYGRVGVRGGIRVGIWGMGL